VPAIISKPVNKTIVDILPARFKYSLSDYFKDFDRLTTHFVSDMWSPYHDISSTYFKNATFIVDKYHYIRQVSWAFEAVRKDVQKRFSKTHRIYFKHSKSLLTSRYDNLSDDEQTQVMVMLDADVQFPQF
jgi:transposase